MKLFIVAALIAVASAGRLEHLERSYLPPDQGSSQGHFGSQSGFGSQGSSSFGSSGSHGFGGQGGHGGFESNGIDTQSAGGRSSGGSFPGATINQYLPPNHGPSGSSGQFSGSLQGFGNGNQRSQYTPQSSFGGSSQYQAPSTQYGAPSGAQARYQGNQQFGSSQGSNQFPAVNRQYLAPQQSSSKYPQQAFDEQTGYQY